MRYLLFLRALIGFWVVRANLRIATGIIITMYCVSVQADIQITEAYVRGLPPGQSVTAAFMRLRNTADKAVEIVAANSDSAKQAEIHTHLQRDGMMRMEKVESILIPAGSDVVMKPGGYHLMLMGLYKPLREGDTVKIQLLAKSGESVSAQLPVRSVLNEHKHKHH